VTPLFSKKKIVGVGDVAPDFTLPSHTGDLVSLADYRDIRCVVLFFYPKDDTSGCIAEVCAFRDQYEAFVDAGAVVIGISSDAAESHQGFATKYHLPFKLLTDAEGQVRKLYRVPSTLGILPGRVTYVIDKAGIIRYVFNSQFNPKRHVEEAFRIIEDIGCANG
jgi:thioredoxin-dependent peroxiredoxin